MVDLRSVGGGTVGLASTGVVLVSTRSLAASAGWGISSGVTSLLAAAAVQFANGPAWAQDAFLGYGMGATGSGISLGFIELVADPLQSSQSSVRRMLPS